MLAATSGPSSIFSISIPHIFLSATQMSLGHLIRAVMPSSFRKECTESVAICVIRTASAAGRGSAPFRPGRSSMVNVRFSPSGEIQVCAPCPRPAVWNFAAITDKLSSPEMHLRTSEFVESTLSSHTMQELFDIGSNFVCIFVLLAKLQFFIRKWQATTIRIKRRTSSA